MARLPNILRDLGAVASSIQVMEYLTDTTPSTDPGSAYTPADYGLSNNDGSWGGIRQTK